MQRSCLLSASMHYVLLADFAKAPSICGWQPGNWPRHIRLFRDYRVGYDQISIHHDCSACYTPYSACTMQYALSINCVAIDLDSGTHPFSTAGILFASDPKPQELNKEKLDFELFEAVNAGRFGFFPGTEQHRALPQSVAVQRDVHQAKVQPDRFLKRIDCG